MNRKPTLKSSLQALLYLAPALVFMTTFTIIPIIRSFMMSFYENYKLRNITKNKPVVWSLDNFQKILADPKFYLALQNTATYVFWVVLCSITISVTVAVLLNQIPFLKGLFRTAYFLPFVTSTVAISVVWSWLYHSEYGLLNYLLGLVGIDRINWLNDPKTAMTAVIIMAIWKSLGFNILLTLVGLGNINETYYKAAQVDGANAWKRFTNITLPLLRPTLFLLSTVGIINGFKVFDEVFALFNGRPGPGGSAMTVVYYLFDQFYVQYNYGMAAATGIILFAIVLIITVFQNIGNKYFEKRGG